MKKIGIILARFQPIHFGHMELIKKAVEENDLVVIFIGSADKLNERNPIPCSIRKDLVLKSLESYYDDQIIKQKIILHELVDLTDETDNSHDWGFYLYSQIVKLVGSGLYTFYYSDGYEIITSWFPGWILRDQISLSLLARGSYHSGLSATEVRRLILEDNITALSTKVPQVVLKNLQSIKAFLKVWENKKIC